MQGISLVIILAVTVEAVVEYIKSICAAFSGEGAKAAVLQLAAAVVSVVLCISSGADLYGYLGIPFSCPAIGTVLTGIFASRGANYVSDLIGRLRSGKGEKNAT